MEEEDRVSSSRPNCQDIVHFDSTPLGNWKAFRPHGLSPLENNPKGAPMVES